MSRPSRPRQGDVLVTTPLARLAPLLADDDLAMVRCYRLNEPVSTIASLWRIDPERVRQRLAAMRRAVCSGESRRFLECNQGHRWMRFTSRLCPTCRGRGHGSGGQREKERRRV